MTRSRSRGRWPWPRSRAALLDVAAKAPCLWLSATEYRSDQDEGSFEVRYAAAAGDNVCQTGFDAVGDPAHGGLFYPCVTINWFEPGTSVALNATDWPSLSHFDGRFVALGIFLLAACGTCLQRLATLHLAA